MKIMAKLASKPSANASERAYAGIVNLLLSRELRVGERTSVKLLAARLGLGRTPVKEAITRLETEGLLSVSDRSGTAVNSIEQEQASQLLAIRSLLEGFAAQAAVKHATMREIDRVLLLARQMRTDSLERTDAQAGTRFVAANVELHDIIVGATRNPYLVRLYSLVRLQLQIVSYLLSRGYDRAAAERRQKEHEAIAHAFAARDARKLRAALKAHVDTTASSLMNSDTVQLAHDRSGFPNRIAPPQGRKQKRVPS